MGTISDYFWLVWRQTKEKTQLLQPWRAYAAIGGGLLSAVVQHFSAISMTPWSVTAWAAVGGVSAYAVLTLGEFFYKMLLVVPVEIWKEHQNHIETQNQRIAQLEEDRPHFERSKITRFHIEGDHQRPDWIRVLVFVVLRNLGADSAVQGWMLTLNGSGLNSSFTDRTLSPHSDLTLDQHLGPNLLYDKTIVPKRGAHAGWLRLEKPKAELGGLTGGMELTLTVSVSFQDADGNQYEIGWPS